MRFDVNDTEQLAAEIDDLFTRSQIFQEYLRKYFVQEDFADHLELIRTVAKRVAGSDQVSDDEVERALYLLMQSGRIKSRKTAAAPIEEAPVKQLSSSQKAWQEYRIYSETHSSAECDARAKVDEGYKSFRLKNLEREAGNTPVSLHQVLGGKKPLTKGTIPPEVQQFADAWKITPVEKTRGWLSAAVSGPVAAARNQQLFDQACELGLI